MHSLFKATIKSFHKTYRQYLLLGVLSILLTSYLFVPFIAWLFNRVLRVLSGGYLVNSDLMRLVLDWRTLGFFLFMLLLVVIIFFLEFAIILVIAREAYFQRRVSLSDALSTAWRRIPRIIGLSSLLMFFLLVLLIPFVDNPFLESLFGQINWPALLRSQILRSRLLQIIYVGLLTGLIYLLLRSIFVFHFIVLTNIPTRRALLASFRMTKRKSLKMILYLMGFNALTVILVLSLLPQLNRLPGLLNLRTNISLIENIMMVIASYLTFLVLLLMVPINMIFLTRLYYQYQRPDLPDDTQFLIRENKTIGRLERIISRYLHHRRLLKHTILTALLVATFVFNFNLYQQAAYLRWNVLVVSHRAHLIAAPENSISGIQAAIDASVDLIEIDIMLSKDNVAVLHHDANLRRLAGQPDRVADLTFAELSQVDIGRRFHPDFEGETIASLDEAITYFLAQENTNSRLLLDLKPDERWETMAEIIVYTLEAYDLVETCYVQSFNPAVIQAVRQRNDQIRVGQILSWAVGDLSALNVDFYAVSKNMISDNFVRQARQDDRQIFVWTVNDENTMRDMLQYDIDGIITDYPERLQSLVALPAAPDVLLAEDLDETSDDDTVE